MLSDSKTLVIVIPNLRTLLSTLKELEITSALLDSITDKCTPQHIVRIEVKSLRDTRQLIEKVGFKEAENFIKDNPHPQLWFVTIVSNLQSGPQSVYER